MPKMKTAKSVRKRFVITKKKKLLVRQAGQDHFNARESSRTTIRKRRDRAIAKVDVKALKKLMPYYRKRG